MYAVANNVMFQLYLRRDYLNRHNLCIASRSAATEKFLVRTSLGLKKQNTKYPISTNSSYIYPIQISINDITLINIRMSVKIGVNNMLLVDNIYCEFIFVP
jgi:hypothetical protein